MLFDLVLNTPSEFTSLIQILASGVCGWGEVMWMTGNDITDIKLLIKYCNYLNEKYTCPSVLIWGLLSVITVTPLFQVGQSASPPPPTLRSCPGLPCIWHFITDTHNNKWYCSRVQSEPDRAGYSVSCHVCCCCCWCRRTCWIKLAVSGWPHTQRNHCDTMTFSLWCVTSRKSLQRSHVSPLRVSLQQLSSQFPSSSA